MDEEPCPPYMSRPVPTPCREGDVGAFERIGGDGLGRMGRMHTRHGIIRTPALLPVVNPNLRIVEPSEMWNELEIDALITNAYIIQRSDELRKEAETLGIHKLLNFPGAVMTDSGTFQSYMYGDLEIDPVEIVKFQRTIGVDIGTMLDVFGRPDMSREEIQDAVSLTAERAPAALKAAAEENGQPTMLLNGPIQGGLHTDLRQKSAREMRKHGFTVHPIGGIVPLMEQQRYLELVQIIAAVRPQIPPGRPVHLFGCGHPHLFALGVALGADLFDSAAYAIFARDDRILSPEGTFRLDEIDVWPSLSPTAAQASPKSLRSCAKDEREKVIARINLEVSIHEVSLVRDAVRRKRLWELVEKRMRGHPRLVEAFDYVIDRLQEKDGDQFTSRLVDDARPTRTGGVFWTSEWVRYRPEHLAARRLLRERWCTKNVNSIRVVRGSRPPHRRSLVQLKSEIGDSTALIATPLGLLPASLEDVAPWSQIQAPNWLEDKMESQREIEHELDELGLKSVPWAYLDAPPQTDLEDLPRREKPHEDAPLDEDTWSSVIDRLAFFCGIQGDLLRNIIPNPRGRWSRTGRLTNLLDSDGIHLASMRLNDGGLRLTATGAKLFANAPVSGQRWIGLPRVNIHSDAVPFVREGRSVFHGFVENVEGFLIPGWPCLVIGPNDELVGHGTAESTSVEALGGRRGMVVRVRDGITTDEQS